MQVITLRPKWAPKAWLKPTVVVVFPFTQGRRGNGSHIDVLAIRRVSQTIEHIQLDLGFIVAVKLQFIVQDAHFFSHLADGFQRCRLGDVDIGWNWIFDFNWGGDKFTNTWILLH